MFVHHFSSRIHYNWDSYLNRIIFVYCYTRKVYIITVPDISIRSRIDWNINTRFLPVFSIIFLIAIGIWSIIVTFIVAFDAFDIYSALDFVGVTVVREKWSWMLKENTDSCLFSILRITRQPQKCRHSKILIPEITICISSSKRISIFPKIIHMIIKYKICIKIRIKSIRNIYRQISCSLSRTSSLKQRTKWNSVGIIECCLFDLSIFDNLHKEINDFSFNNFVLIDCVEIDVFKSKWSPSFVHCISICGYTELGFYVSWIGYVVWVEG